MERWGRRRKQKNSPSQPVSGPGLRKGFRHRRVRAELAWSYRKWIQKSRAGSSFLSPLFFSSPPPPALRVRPAPRTPALHTTPITVGTGHTRLSTGQSAAHAMAGAWWLAKGVQGGGRGRIQCCSRGAPPRPAPPRPAPPRPAPPRARGRIFSQPRPRIGAGRGSCGQDSGWRGGRCGRVSSRPLPRRRALAPDPSSHLARSEKKKKLSPAFLTPAPPPPRSFPPRL